MKTKLRYFYLVLILCATLPASAQAGMQAANDSIFVAVGTPQIVIANVLANDLHYQYNQSTNMYITTPATLANSTISQVATDNPSLQLQADGSVAITATLPAGVYSLSYEVCYFPDFCDLGIVTVFINTCQAPTPFVGYTNPIYCDGTSTMLISNLPSGNWTLRKTKNYVFLADITGQGSQASIVIDSPGNYGFQIINDGNGCMSIKRYREVESTPCTFNINYSNPAYQDFNANGLVDAGDKVNYGFSLTNNTNTNFNTITVTSSSVNVSGGPLALLANNSTNSNTFTGFHVITQQDIDLGVAVTNVNATSLSPATTVYKSNTFQLNTTRGFRLIAFVDSNGDGIKQSNEPLLPHAQFQYEKNGDGNFHSLFGSNRIIYENNVANSYDFSCGVYGSYASYYTVTTPLVQNATVNTTGITTYYFAFTETPFTDTRVNLFGSNSPVAGFAYTNVIRYSNASSQTIPNGTLTFVKDAAITVNSVSQSGTVANANGFTYNFINLGPFETRTITVNMTIPPIPAVTLGNVITHSASLSIPPGDIIPANNSDTYSATIIGSFDPNDKTEAHNGKIEHADFTADDHLTYMIRFENTGTSPALNIKIKDVLDPQLDETSVRLVGSSAVCTLDRTGSELTWRFDGINLPPSVIGTNTGHGYVTFEIKPKPGYAIGDIIPNSADIYFDFNPAIVTEPCLTEFIAPLGVAEFEDIQVMLYPNPVNSILSIDSKNNIDHIAVHNALGQMVIEKVINNMSAKIDCTSFSKGIYFVTVQSGNQNKTYKVIRQ